MRRIKRFDYIFLSLAATLTMAGCGDNHKREIASVFSTSAQMAPVQELTAEERTIATRICYAYQSKNTAFQTPNYYGGTFNFNVGSRDCSNTSDAYAVTSVLTSPERYSLIFSTTNPKPFVNKVQTNQSGFLSLLCTKILTNQPVSNTVDDTVNKIQIRFFRSDIDSYSLQYFALKSGVMKITMAETFKVRTQFDLTTNQILGMDERYSKQQVCATDDSKYSEFDQTFSSFISPI